MALTNYLSQSHCLHLDILRIWAWTLCRIGAALGIVLTVVHLSDPDSHHHWWMKRFRYGPAEWLWRSLTYGRLPADEEIETITIFVLQIKHSFMNDK